MNIELDYENLLKAKTVLDRLVEENQFDIATKVKLNNVSSRIELTLIDLKVELEGKNIWKKH